MSWLPELSPPLLWLHHSVTACTCHGRSRPAAERLACCRAFSSACSRLRRFSASASGSKKIGLRRGGGGGAGCGPLGARPPAHQARAQAAQHSCGGAGHHSPRLPRPAGRAPRAAHLLHACTSSTAMQRLACDSSGHLARNMMRDPSCERLRLSLMSSRDVSMGSICARAGAQCAGNGAARQPALQHLACNPAWLPCGASGACERSASVDVSMRGRKPAFTSSNT